MKPFRLARRCLPGFAPGRPTARHALGRRWLRSLGGLCLAALLAGWPVMLACGSVAGGSVAGGSVAGPPADGPGVVLTAMQRPQARVINPGPPTGLTVTAGNGQVSLSWTAPASNGGAAIIGYDVYLGTSSHGESASPVNTSLITGTSVTVKNLANGTTYYFKVTAVNKAGQGSASVAASATPASAVTAPGAPTGLTAAPGNGRVTLSWTAPAADGGAGISGYWIYRGTSPGGESRVPVNGALVQATTYTVTGLANGTAYYFTVAAVNAARHQGNNSGQASAAPVVATAPATASTSVSPAAGTGAPGAPGAPTGLIATAGNGQVTLSWTAPAPDGPPSARYDVYEGTSPGFSLGTPVGSTTGTSGTVTGLADGTTYYFVVAAVGANGTMSGATGEASAEPTGNAVLTSKKVPKPVIVSLAAVAIGATAGACTLAARRPGKRPPRSRPSAAPPSEVRAVPDPGRPSRVSIREIGTDETYTVRLEPLPAAIITTIEDTS
jgi:hypothetical protein